MLATSSDSSHFLGQGDVPGEKGVPPGTLVLTTAARSLGATPPRWSLSTMPTVSMTRERPPGLPLRERQRDEPPTVRFGSSPEHGLPEPGTNLGGLQPGPPTGAWLDVAHAVQASRRGLSRGFFLGNRASCAMLAHTARLRLEERHTIGNPSTTPHRRPTLDRERTLDGPPGASPRTRPRCGVPIAPR